LTPTPFARRAGRLGGRNTIVRGVSFLVTVLCLAAAGPAQVFAETEPSEASCGTQVAQGMLADLADWPFGAREELIESEAARSRSIAYLREVAADDVPVPKLWRPHLDDAREESLIVRLTIVNDLVNRVPYRRVAEWLHPEIFLSNGGDCDCAAVTKYMLLRKLGVPAADMRVTLAYWPRRQAQHAFLVVRGKDPKLGLSLLDINHKRVVAALYCTKYVPLLSVNEEGIWRHAETSKRITDHFLNPRIVRPKK